MLDSVHQFFKPGNKKKPAFPVEILRHVAILSEDLKTISNISRLNKQIHYLLSNMSFKTKMLLESIPVDCEKKFYEINPILNEQFKLKKELEKLEYYHVKLKSMDSQPLNYLVTWSIAGLICLGLYATYNVHVTSNASLVMRIFTGVWLVIGSVVTPISILPLMGSLNSLREKNA